MGPHYSWLALRCVDFGLVSFVIYFETQSFVRREMGERALRGRNSRLLRDSNSTTGGTFKLIPSDSKRPRYLILG